MIEEDNIIQLTEVIILLETKGIFTYVLIKQKKKKKKKTV